MSQSECIIDSCAVDAAMPAAEERLLQALQRGENQAFDQLYAEYQGLIYNLAYRIMGEREEAFDLTQEVYLSIFKHVGSFHGQSSLKTWIYRITVNACLNRHRWWRRRKKDATVPLNELRMAGGNGVGSSLHAARSSPEDEALRSELEEHIQRGLDRLPAKQRAAVVLRDLEGLAYEEIAEALGISLGTVKSRIARGREMLRLQLSPLLQETARGCRALPFETRDQPVRSRS